MIIVHPELFERIELRRCFVIRGVKVQKMLLGCYASGIQTPDVAREPEEFLVEAARVVDHLGDEAGLVGLLSREFGRSKKIVHRARCADQVGEATCAGVGRRKTEFQLFEVKDRSFRGKAKIRGQSELHAAADDQPVDQGDYGDRQFLQCETNLSHRFCIFSSFGSVFQLGQFLQIPARDPYRLSVSHVRQGFDSKDSRFRRSFRPSGQQVPKLAHFCPEFFC